jgi:hypothetical protein
LTAISPAYTHPDHIPGLPEILALFDRLRQQRKPAPARTHKPVTFIPMTAAQCIAADIYNNHDKVGQAHRHIERMESKTQRKGYLA